MYPDPVLREKSAVVVNWSDDLTELVKNMQYTMECNNDAVGLSAIQVGVPLRIFLAKINNKDYEVLINPVIVESWDTFGIQEGCLSFPGVFDLINRAKYVKVKYQTNPIGEFPYVTEAYSVTNTFRDLDAIIIQHELDHLDGILMYDHFTPQFQKRVDKRIRTR